MSRPIACRPARWPSPPARERILLKGAVLGFHRGAFPGSKPDDTELGVERRHLRARPDSARRSSIARWPPRTPTCGSPMTPKLSTYRSSPRSSDGRELAMGRHPRDPRPVGPDHAEIGGGLSARCGREYPSRLRPDRSTCFARRLASGTTQRGSDRHGRRPGCGGMIMTLAAAGRRRRAGRVRPAARG